MAEPKRSPAKKPAAAKKEPAAAAPPPPEPEPLEVLERIKIRLGQNVLAKIFTSRGLAVNRSVIELPYEEAQRYIDREQATPTDDDINWIEPVTDAEHGLKYRAPK